MNGVLSPVQIKMVRELRKHIDELEKHIRELDQDINDAMSDPEKEAAKRLTQIPGIGEDSAKIIISVIGVDMSRFPTDRHICSWAGISPGNKESAKKKLSARTTKGNKLLRSTLVVCAHSAVMKKESYFSSLYNRIAAHRGKKESDRGSGTFNFEDCISYAEKRRIIQGIGKQLLSSKDKGK